MIVDSSAAVAVILGEEDRGALIRALADAPRRSMSASTLLETSMVVLSRLPNAAGFAEVDQFVEASDIEIEPTTRADALAAREAFRVFGKRNHPAALNFGDCFTYALARRLGRPILCKGDDFAQTDALVVAFT